jgi:hypothetical protein
LGKEIKVNNKDYEEYNDNLELYIRIYKLREALESISNYKWNNLDYEEILYNIIEIANNTLIEDENL